ncbi:MAG: hypothetical protein IJ327_05205 [Lachnospiraceae bacterium]|nr:hypothetical protein [Lachnospiraceae bacterium]
MSKKMIFGILITIVGLVFAGFFIFYAAMEPYAYGLWDSLKGNEVMIPFIISMVVMCSGIAICFIEAY